MQEVVYVDVLLFVNLFVNYFLLRAAVLLSREKFRRWRLILGAAIGSTYALIIFLPPLHPIFLVVLKAAMAVSIVLIAFGWGSLRRFIRLFFCFLAETFLFGGINYAVYAFLRPGGMLYGNAVIYYNISVPMLIAVTAICYALAVLVSKLIRRNSPENLIGEAEIRLAGKILHVPMMIDSGNGLADPFTDDPVSLLCAESLAKLLTPEMVSFLLGDSELLDSQTGRSVRLIPYSTVSSSGVLRAFRCDMMIVSVSGKYYRIQGALLAAVREPFDHGRYQLLVHPRLVEGENTRHTMSLKSRGVRQGYDSKDTVEAAPLFDGQKKQACTGDFLYQRFADTSPTTGEGGGSPHDPAVGGGGLRRTQRVDHTQSAPGCVHRP